MKRKKVIERNFYNHMRNRHDLEDIPEIMRIYHMPTGALRVIMESADWSAPVHKWTIIMYGVLVYKIDRGV